MPVCYRYSKGLDWYKDQLPGVHDGQMLMEATSTYFYYPQVPKRVYRMNKDVKLILIVMEPVQRMFIDYFYQQREVLDQDLSAPVIVGFQRNFTELVYNATSGKVIYDYRGLHWSSYANRRDS